MKNILANYKLNIIYLIKYKLQKLKKILKYFKDKFIRFTILSNYLNFLELLFPPYISNKP
jgi:hypothetical protein